MDQGIEEPIFYSASSFTVEELDIDIKEENLDTDINDDDLDTDINDDDLDTNIKEENMVPTPNNIFFINVEPDMNISETINSTTNNCDVESRNIIISDKPKTNQLVPRPPRNLKLPLQDEYMTERDHFRYNLKKRGRPKKEGEIGNLEPVRCPICNTKLQQFHSIKKHILTLHKHYIQYIIMKQNGVESINSALLYIVKNIKKSNLDALYIKEFLELHISSENWQSIRRNIFSKKTISPTSVASGALSSEISGSNTKFEPLQNTSSVPPTSVASVALSSEISGNITKFEPLQNTSSDNEVSKRKCKNRLKKNDCTICCDYLNILKYHNYLVGSIKCNHLEKPCCCSKLSSKIIIPKIPTEGFTDYDPFQKTYKEFFVKYDDVSNDVLYFCFVCQRYGNKSSGKQFKGGDYINKGVSFRFNPHRKTTYLKRHLASNQHADALKKRLDNPKMTNEGLLKYHEPKIANENMCRTVQFVIDNGHTYSEISKLATLFDLILPHQTNPLGNHHHLTKNSPDLVKAIYISKKNELQRKLKSIHPLTNEMRRHTIALHKATAPYDATRQTLVSTYVDDDGLVKEVVVGCKRIYDKTAKGCLDNMTRSLDGLIDTKSVLAVCTDGESVYAGHIGGMYQRMIEDDMYSSNTVHLPDICNKTELLLLHNQPTWLKEVLNQTEQVAIDLSAMFSLRQTLLEIGEGDTIFFPISQLCNTRYYEYAYKQLDSVLKNTGFFLKYLPKILDDPNLTKHHAKCAYIYDLVRNPKFIARAMLSNTIFLKASLFEKKAQSKYFNCFDLKKNIMEFNQELTELLNEIPKSCTAFLENGTFNYAYSVQKVPCETRAQYTFKDGETTDIKEEFNNWLKIILENFDNYLNVPDIIEKIISFFDENTEPEIKEVLFRHLFCNLNINHQSCGLKCKGIKQCKCVSKDIKTFLTHFSSQDLKANNLKLLFAYYLSEKSIKKLNIVNILRLMEAALLLKASQASSEQVNSTIANMINGRFEMKYIKPEAKPDMVEYMIFLKSNSNMVDIDVEDAMEELIKMGFHEALLENEYKTRCRSTVSTTLESLRGNGNGLEKKRKRLNGINVNIKKRIKNYDNNEIKNINETETINEDEIINATDTINETEKFNETESINATDTINKTEKINETESINKTEKINETEYINKTEKINETESINKTDKINGTESINKTEKINETETFNNTETEAIVPGNCQVKDNHDIDNCSVDINQVTEKHIDHSKEVEKIFCKCEISSFITTDEDGWIGCQNGKMCNSYIDRMELLKKEGGDWFHFKCVKLNDNYKKGWYCYKCLTKKTHKYQIMKLLKKENLKICRVPSGYNNINYVLSYLKYKNFKPASIKITFNSMYNFLKNIRKSNNLNVIEKKILSYLKDGDDPETNFNSLKVQSPKEYINMCLTLFGLTEKKDIWLLSQDSPEVFKWHCIHQNEQNHSLDYYMIFKETKGYNPIINMKNINKKNLNVFLQEYKIN